MLPEIVNYIFTFIQSPTNEIMKEFIRNVQSYDLVSDTMLCDNMLCETMLCILEMNKEYGFINYNNIRFEFAYYYKCNHCKGYLTTDEYRYKHGLCKSCKILNILFNSI
jgi:hypothetical protein